MRTSKPKPSVQVDVVVEEPEWRHEGRRLLSDLRRAAELTLSSQHASGTKPASKSAGMTILLGSDAKLKSLNGQFRGKSKPTNVLSFPSSDEAYWGDVAIAYGVATSEAAAENKSLHDHVLHLAVHGVLHLLGYDHETARDARIMEPLEVEILAQLGIADPYHTRIRAVSTS